MTTPRAARVAKDMAVGVGGMNALIPFFHLIGPVHSYGRGRVVKTLRVRKE